MNRLQGKSLMTQMKRKLFKSLDRKQLIGIVAKQTGKMQRQRLYLQTYK